MESRGNPCWHVPVKNRARALDFYSAILRRDLREEGVTPPFELREEGGGVARLSVEGNLDEALEIVWSNGGQILELQLDKSEAAQCALVLDSEGNRIAIYARS